MIWLEADEAIAEKDRFEEKKTELDIQKGRVQFVADILADIRQIALAQIPLTGTEYMDFIYSLPSFKGDKEKAMKETRWTATMRKPGEIPEWKKKQLQNKDKSPDQEPAKKTG